MRPRLTGPITQSEVHIVLLCVGGVIAMSLAFARCANATGDDALVPGVTHDGVAPR
jgi:hypothetical protein